MTKEAPTYYFSSRDRASPSPHLSVIFQQNNLQKFDILSIWDGKLKPSLLSSLCTATVMIQLKPKKLSNLRNYYSLQPANPDLLEILSSWMEPHSQWMVIFLITLKQRFSRF